jgi:NADH-quinone oxidoreductase subunit C
MSVAVVERVKARFGSKVVETVSFRGDETIVVSPDAYYEVAKFLRDDSACDFSMFTDITCVDYPTRDARFEIVLNVYSLHKGHRVRLKTRLFEIDEDEPADATRPTTVPTVSTLWAAANWFEREVWDMFGVKFEGHPDMRRLLLYEEFEGHPLRKDYPADKTQPLVPYRTGPDVLGKQLPFLADEGMPFGRKDWMQRDAAWTNEDTGDRSDAPPPDGTAPVPQH